jgi:hypothetical protein
MTAAQWLASSDAQQILNACRTSDRRKLTLVVAGCCRSPLAVAAGRMGVDGPLTVEDIEARADLGPAGVLGWLAARGLPPDLCGRHLHAPGGGCFSDARPQGIMAATAPGGDSRCPPMSTTAPPPSRTPSSPRPT